VNPKEIALSIPHDSVIVPKDAWEAMQRAQPGPLNVDAEGFLRGFPDDNASMYFGTYIRERFQAHKRPVNRDELAARMETAAREASKGKKLFGSNTVAEMKARAWVAAAAEALRFIGSPEAPQANGQAKVARQKEALHELEGRLQFHRENNKEQKQTIEALTTRRDELEAELARVKAALQESTGKLHNIADALEVEPGASPMLLRNAINLLRERASFAERDTQNMRGQLADKCAMLRRSHDELMEIARLVEGKQNVGYELPGLAEKARVELTSLRSRVSLMEKRISERRDSYNALQFAGSKIALGRIMDEIGDTNHPNRSDTHNLEVLHEYVTAQRRQQEHVTEALNQANREQAFATKFQRPGAGNELNRIMDDLGEVRRDDDAENLRVIRAYLEARKSDCERVRKELSEAGTTINRIRSLLAEPFTGHVREYKVLVPPAPYHGPHFVETSFNEFLEKTKPKVDPHLLLKDFWRYNGAYPTNNPSPGSIRSITQALNNQGFGVK
jgi:DNA repair exonuclease SbcCD ATPase subunit